MKSLVNYLLMVLLFVGCTMEIPGDIVVEFSEVKNKGTVIFTNDSEGAESYVWDFGDGKTSTEKAPTHIYTKSDTYKVNLIAQNGGVSKGLSRSIVVNVDIAASKPKAAFTASTYKCKAPCEVTFTNGSQDATNFSWNFGNGVTSTLRVPDKVRFTEPKTYHVVLNVTGPGGSDSATEDIVVESTAVSQTFEKIGDYTFGGSGYDQFRAGISTSDGGAILVGSSNSQPNNGDNDFFIVKMNSNGSEAWQKKYGGSRNDGATCIIAIDGGYLVGGYSNSDTGGNKNAGNKGDYDFWVVKINTNGDKTGDYSFGGNSGDLMNAMVKTSDNGILLGGYTSSGKDTGNKTADLIGDKDFWLVKINSNGEKQWDNAYGGLRDDRINSMTMGTDNVVMMAGYSDSPTGFDKTSPKYDHYDYWVLKVKENGDRITGANYTFGGNKEDQIYSIISDGGWYVSGGESYSNGGEGTKGESSSRNKGVSDYYVYKFDNTGAKTWEFTYGGNDKDKLTALLTVPNVGLVLAGESKSSVSGDKTAAAYGKEDAWILKVDKDGKSVDNVSYGGSGSDKINGAIRLSDGSCLFIGESDSPVSTNKTAPNISGADGWVIKVKVN